VYGKVHAGTSVGSAVPENSNCTSPRTVRSPSFYRKGNPYVFRMQIGSDFFHVPIYQALSLYLHLQPGCPSKQLVTVLCSTAAFEFYSSTIWSVITALDDAGFKNATEIKYDFLCERDSQKEDAKFFMVLQKQACLKDLEEAEAYVSCYIRLCTGGARYNSKLVLKQESQAANRMKY
jgi:hypothetical protein